MADARLDRDGVVAELNARGIGTGVYYPRVVFDYDAYRDHPMITTVSSRMQRGRPGRSSRCRSTRISQYDLDRIATSVSELLRG